MYRHIFPDVKLPWQNDLKISEKFTIVDYYYISLISKFSNFSTNLVKVITTLVKPYHFNQTSDSNIFWLTVLWYVV